MLRKEKKSERHAGPTKKPCKKRQLPGEVAWNQRWGRGLVQREREKKKKGKKGVKKKKNKDLKTAREGQDYS